MFQELSVDISRVLAHVTPLGGPALARMPPHARRAEAHATPGTNSADLFSEYEPGARS
jgi:hypothetical protein